MGDWKTVNSNNKRYENETTWRPEKSGDKTSGVFIDKRENLGMNKSSLYILQQPDGSVVSIWGSAVLDRLMNEVNLQEEVEIEFQGKQPGSRPGTTLKMFEVRHREKDNQEQGDDTTEEVNAEDVPF